MVAAFSIASLSSSISLPTTKSSSILSGPNKNRINNLSYSYSSSLTLHNSYLGYCFRNVSPSLSLFENGVFRSRNIFFPSTFSFNGRARPQEEKDDSDEDDNGKSLRFMALAPVVYLACTMLMIFVVASMEHMDGSNLNNLPRKRKHSSNSSLKKIKEEVMEIANEEGLNEAIRELKTLYKENKEDMEKANYIEMLLVPMLIQQEKYKEALSCKCLSSYNKPGKVITRDRRIFVYKIFVYLMTCDYVKAKLWFKALVRKIDHQTEDMFFTKYTTFEQEEQEEDDMSEQEEDVMSEQEEDDMSEQEEDDMSEQEEDVMSEQVEDVMSEQEDDMSEQEEDDMSEQAEDDTSEQKEDDMSEQAEDDTSEQDEEDMGLIFPIN